MATPWSSCNAGSFVTFSNPAGAAAAASATAYTTALLTVLGDRDPIEVLEQLLPWLTARVSSLDDATLRRPEMPGKWSVMEVIQHLADSDLVFGYRLRMMVTEDRPAIPGYDQDAWARTFRYRDVPLATALDQLRGQRIANIAVLRGLTPAQLAREGLHSERGAESAGFLLRLMAAHDLVHRRQIDRILDV
jgi:uncharacterized damage-inducible protein DinB